MLSTADISVCLAQTGTWDKIRSLPFQTWLIIGLGLGGIFILITVWKTLKKLNDFAPLLVTSMAAAFILFYWVYNRNEPAVLSPFVEKLGQFLPSQPRSAKELDRIR